MLSDLHALYCLILVSDFDEQTVDDYDVDMSGYYEEGAGDKDAQDYLTIRQEKRRRDGIEGTDRFTASKKVQLYSRSFRVQTNILWIVVNFIYRYNYI
mgnify:CR=1 FL=1